MANAEPTMFYLDPGTYAVLVPLDDFAAQESVSFILNTGPFVVESSEEQDGWIVMRVQATHRAGILDEGTAVTGDWYRWGEHPQRASERGDGGGLGGLLALAGFAVAGLLLWRPRRRR